jgi:hypothetical protein
MRRAAFVRFVTVSGAQAGTSADVTGAIELRGTPHAYREVYPDKNS